jgi:hypothetical protein
MAYSKAKLKSNVDRASPCFKPFLIRNLSDKFLPIRTLLYVSFRHIFINLSCFMEIQNSMGILYKTSLLTELYIWRFYQYILCRNERLVHSPKRPDWFWNPLGAVSFGSKRSGGKACHVSPFSTGVKNERSWRSTPLGAFIERKRENLNL